jgi:hypothetical protein
MVRKPRGIYMLMFVASLALAVVVYLFVPSFTSLMVVPITTFLVKGLDLI